MHVGVALDAAGWHPAAWREAAADPAGLCTAVYWAGLVREAEAGGIDFVTIEDSFALQSTYYDRPDDRVDQVRGRLDAVLVAARVAPLTTTIGLLPTVVVTHTDPVRVAAAIATLDQLSGGRAGIRIQVSGKAHEAALFGRRHIPAVGVPDFTRPEQLRAMAERFDEAAGYVEVLRSRWGSPARGLPPVFCLAHMSVPYRLGARAADIVSVTPRDETDIAAVRGEIRAEQERAGRAAGNVRIFGELVVFLDESAEIAIRRKARLDSVAGAPYISDALIFTGTPGQLADLLTGWHAAGLSGFRLRPGALPHDLRAITRGLMPGLWRRGLRSGGPFTESLRGGPRPAARVHEEGTT
ncbi:LLM class flavin-dependent oxidoreductase [Amycolatopsis sp.]|uniref:LLM class flavin-dependent oxidoreductase n=1 Tax=Amycolatopsis sp. TaxID=37632 RepID=UPI002CE771DA|nr:LLM class flavin-dependent oxidoreductase [Amycolatopsis sp.]HVV11358.1 LLM class flavin-dependent oxidoreductase [Amycolatopsis sp.]